MALNMRQELRMSQQLVMTPQLQQAIKLLQLSRMELQDLVRGELLENPLLDEQAEMGGTADERFTNVNLQRGKQDALRIARIGPEALTYAEILIRAKAGQMLKLTAAHPRATRADVEVELP